MTTIASRRALPRKDTPPHEAISTTADVLELLKRSNHATAFAGWTVTTIAMGLVIQVGALRSIESFPLTLVLVGLLVPVLAATARTGVLLASAGRAAADAGGEGEPTGAVAGATSLPTEPEAAARLARDRLRSAVTSTQLRGVLARRALMWAYGAGAAFLAWSLAVLLLVSR
ncbi:MAG TPA: hypothetical protein VF069_22255 [Streptosporangiaceae bacterium]